ncbi:MAG: protein GlmU [Thermodesulfobacteriota bacterium]
MSKIKELLINKGVFIQNPQTVTIDSDVNPDNIEPGAYISQGCVIKGKNIYISSGAVIGSKGPASVENCAVDEGAELGSGFFKESVFLPGSKTGSGAEIREGCIMEEKSSAAHNVGMKQTILFPYAALGSIINFCDCMLTGGTSSKNHSEVGSSFIHFNFTPDQDKATPSIMGNVYEGVFLDQPPVFLGGQGGMAGPCRLEFGITSAAGSIIRRDELRRNRLIYESVQRNFNIEKKAGVYSSINRIVKNNIFYIANLASLKQWYLYVRKGFLRDKILEYALQTIDLAVEERKKRLVQLAEKAKNGIDLLEKEDKSSKLLEIKRNFCTNSDKLADLISDIYENDLICSKKRDDFLLKFNKNNSDKAYLEKIHNLDVTVVNSGIDWLSSVTEEFTDQTSKLLIKFDLKDN